MSTQKRKRVTTAAKLAQKSKADNWDWVSQATSTNGAFEITEEQRLATCSLSQHSSRPFCKNRFNKSVTPTRTSDKQADHAIVISDDDDDDCSKKNCKDNPNCLNYLGQEKWQDEEGARTAFLKVAKLGPNPMLNARDPDLPVGLRNLGATCYANAFIQVWFRDLAFREGVYQCQPSLGAQDDIQDSPIFQLQVTFAALQQCSQTVFNPVKLVDSLQLRASEQQDAQEFSKLFMSHLASEFDKQEVPALKNLFSNQFEGKQVYGTMCRSCKFRSEQESEFLELEINLEPNCTLENRVMAALQSENLTGDNKYFCSQCQSLQNAIRYTELRQLPPVLHFSILRFVYDIENQTRRKSKQIIQFPPIIDMAKFLSKESKVDPTPEALSSSSSPRPSDYLYELKGVLLHKGGSAYHGHYEAQVFDSTREQWFQFNDEEVTPINSLHSLPSKIDDDDELDIIEVKTGRGKGQKRRVILSDGEEPASVKKSSMGGSVSSKDAYMLIYTRKESIAAQVDGCTDQALAEQPSTPPNNSLSDPPSLAIKEVEMLNNEHDEACSRWTERQQTLVEEFNAVRKFKMDIYHSWQLKDGLQESIVLSSQAIHDWLLSEITPRIKKDPSIADEKRHSLEAVDPEQPSNGMVPSRQGSSLMDIDPRVRFFSSCEITCEHGNLDPNRAGNMKRVTKVAFDRMTSENHCRFSEHFTPDRVCDKCVRQTFGEKRYALQHPAQVKEFELAEMNGSTASGYWISKLWLKDWRNLKPKMHIVGQSDPWPDSGDWKAHVTCHHGGLVVSLTNRKKITDLGGDCLKGIFPQWHPTSVTASPCVDCGSDAEQDQNDTYARRRQHEDEKQRLRHLFFPTNLLVHQPPLVEGWSYALIPADWYRACKHWKNDFLKYPRPDKIDTAQFVCEHDQLLIDPNVADDLRPDILTIPIADWNLLTQCYETGPRIQLSVVSDGAKDILIHDIPVCQECRHARRSTFTWTEIKVYILGDDEPEPTPESHKVQNVMNSHESLLFGSDKLKQDGEAKPFVTTATGTRKSKRLQQHKRAGTTCRIRIEKVSTVKDMKISIQEISETPSLYQRLFYKGHELTDNGATVQELDILADDILEMKADKPLDEDALYGSDVEILDGAPQAKRKRTEEGRAFGGTLLGSASWPKPDRPKTKSKESSQDPNMPPRPNSASGPAPSHPEQGALTTSGGGHSPPANNEEDLDSEMMLDCPHCTLKNPLYIERCAACDQVLLS